MFSIRVHKPGVEGHTMYSCARYTYRPSKDGATIVMFQRDGAQELVDIPSGGTAYVMSGDGKTVDTVRTGADGQRHAQLRGGR